MAIELKIIWEGEVPGVAEHRVSIAAFGPALNQLLVAYRRIASNMMRNAAGYAETGRLKELANFLDIEIVSIEGNSTGLSAVFIYHQPPPPQSDLFFPHGIPERAGVELVEAIDNEGHGRLYNTGVRKYLAELPPGLSEQRYELSSNGKALHEPVIIGPLSLAETMLSMPYLLSFSGSIVGVGFDPGRNEVRVKTTEHETLRLMATPTQVERALELRGGTVTGIAVRGKESRLLSLNSTSAMPFKLTSEMETLFVFERWDGLLRRLAQ